MPGLLRYSCITQRRLDCVGGNRGEKSEGLRGNAEFTYALLLHEHSTIAGSCALPHVGMAALEATPQPRPTNTRST
jgi:hypothetical protein